LTLEEGGLHKGLNQGEASFWVDAFDLTWSAFSFTLFSRRRFIFSCAARS
jgi:hypothetical protein